MFYWIKIGGIPRSNVFAPSNKHAFEYIMCKKKNHAVLWNEKNTKYSNFDAKPLHYYIKINGYRKTFFSKLMLL